MLKWLLWPDTHFPKEDRAKVKVMMKVLKQWQPDHLTFLGDLDDMEAPSRFADGSKEEVEQRLSVTVPTVDKFLREVRSILPNARIDWFMGNHEDRLMNYISTKAKALEGFVTYDMVYPIKDLGIKIWDYSEPPVKLHGNFYVTHGSLISQHSADSGRKEFDKYGVSGFSGHTHRLGQYYKTQPLITPSHCMWYECGHLSDVKQAGYTTLPNWQHGFGYAYVDGSRVYPGLVPFVGNTIVLDGKKIT